MGPVLHLTWNSAASWKVNRRIRMTDGHEAVKFHVVFTPRHPGPARAAPGRAADRKPSHKVHQSHLTWCSAATWKFNRRIRMTDFHEAADFHVISVPRRSRRPPGDDAARPVGESVPDGNNPMAACTPAPDRGESTGPMRHRKSQIAAGRPCRSGDRPLMPGTSQFGLAREAGPRPGWPGWPRPGWPGPGWPRPGWPGSADRRENRLLHDIYSVGYRVWTE